MSKYLRMKCILPLIILIFFNAFAFGQFTYTTPQNWIGLTVTDLPISNHTQVGTNVMRTQGTIYRHINMKFEVQKDNAQEYGWLTEFNDFFSLGSPGINTDSFLYQGNNIITGNGIITFDTVYFNIGAGNIMEITNNIEPYSTGNGPYLGYAPGGIMVTKYLYFNNGLTTTNRAYPVNGAIVFVNNANYSNTTALSDVQHVDGFVTEVNYENHPGAKGHGGLFTFPVGNNSEVYQLVRSGLLTDDYYTLTVGWVGGDPNTTPDLTSIVSGGSGTINATDASNMGSGIQSVIGVGFWDWHYQDMLDANGEALPVTSDNQTITVSIPDISGWGASAANLRLVGWNANTQKWENLSEATGSLSATGVTKGSTLTGVIPTTKTITALAIGSISIVLPVTFKDFTVKTSNCQALLEWKTQMEFNNSHFNVERSENGIQFTTIARVNGAGNSNTLQKYNYTDETPFSGKSYYRITQVDYDGKNSSTPIQTIELNCDNALLKVYPNPASNQINIKAKKAITQINIISSSGQSVLKYQPSLSQAGGIFSMNIQSIQSGIYFVQIINKDGTTELIKLLKK